MSNVPKLRFKEFTDEWETKKLESVSCIYDGTHQTPKYTENGIRFISVENINDIYNSNKYISKEDYINDFKIKPQINDIFMTRITAGEIGATAILDKEEDIAYYVSLALIRPQSKRINSLFLKNYISSKYFKKELNRRIIHVAFPKKINLGDINKCIIEFPTLQEQEKIGYFLSLVDKKISLQTEKVKALKDYKKGLMQKIFSKELRFKDENGNEFPEWKEKKLGEVASIVGGGIPCTSNENFWDGEIQWFTPTEIKNQKYVMTSNRTITKEGLNKSSAKLLPKGTVLLTTRATLGDMTIIKQESTTNQGFQSIIVGNDLSNEFIYYLQPQIKEYCNKNASGSTFLEISKKTIEKFKFSMPSLKEQQKIANLLSLIDLKIEKEQEKLDLLECYKKGLLQQMFV